MYAFQNEPKLYICLIFNEVYATNWREIFNLSDCNRTRTHNNSVPEWTLNYFSQFEQMIELFCEYLSLQCIWLYILVMSRTLFSMNPNSIVTPILGNLMLKNMIELAKWLSCVLSTYVYGAFYSVFFSGHVRVSEWTQTL